MNLTTISEISKKLSISTRTLRYYEQIGLIESVKKDDYAYRTYDEATVTRIQQILVLRKLRIPLKQIALILKSENTAAIIDAFQQNLTEVDDEITALSTIRDIINTFITRLKESIHQDIKLNLLDDTTLLEAVDALMVRKIPLKEEKTAADLEQASETLNRLTDRDVRIVYLPPATVLSHHVVGDDEQGRPPEDQHDPLLDSFERELAKTKPDFRHYGFVHGVDAEHGYERWITIPDDMEVKPPFSKKHFLGGMYAASVLPVDDFENGWLRLEEWAIANEMYEPATSGLWNGWLEEHTTAAQIITGAEMYIDLLLPIKLREKKRKSIQLGYIEGSEDKCGFYAGLLKKKGFNIAGYTIIKPGDFPNEEFYLELANDGRLERLKASLKPGAPLLLFESYDDNCIAAKKELGIWSYRRTVCADLSDIIDPDTFLSKDLFIQKLSPKHWIEFEFTRDLRKKISEGKAENAHSLVQKLGWRFSGSGHFDVYRDGDIFLNDENKNQLIHFWMPVVPLK